MEKIYSSCLTVYYVVTMLMLRNPRMTGYIEILNDPIFYLILGSGIGVALFMDNRDPSVEVKKPLKYFFYSFFASVLLSVLAVAVKVETQIGWLPFYGLIAVTTVLSPAIVRKLADSLPSIFAGEIGGLIASIFRGVANKIDNKKDEQ